VVSGQQAVLTQVCASVNLELLAPCGGGDRQFSTINFPLSSLKKNQDFSSIWV